MEDLYIDRGDPGVILKIYQRILDVAPRNSLVEFLYARLCLRLEMIDEAIDTLNTLVAEGIEFKGIHKAMAEAYIHRGETDKAVEEFRIAFPAEHVYIPFRCDNCHAKMEEWEDFCNSCNSWGTINVRKEDFLRVKHPNCGPCTKAKIGLKGHSRHLVPLLLVTKTGERDGMAFHERNYVTGSIGKTATNN